MDYPRAEIYLDRLEYNSRKVVTLCGSRGIDVAAVTKGFCAYPQIAEAILRGA